MHSLKGMQARDWFSLILIAAVVGACGVLGVSYVLGEGWPIFDAVQTALLCLAATVVCAVVFFLADACLERISVARRRSAYKKGRANRIFAKITPRWKVKSILLFSLVMFVFWLPWFIANLPGTTYWDTYYQMYMTYPENHPIAIIPFGGHADETQTDAWLTDHHPVLTTLIYGAFAQVSDQLTGNWMAGVFAFVSIQTVLFLIEFTACVAYMRARKCPLSLCFAAYAFFAIMPFVSTWAMCMVKDSMFALFFVPYFVMMFEAVRTRGRSFCRGRTMVLFTICALMLCLTKKTGLFIVIPVTIIGAWLFRPRKMREAWAEGAGADAWLEGADAWLEDAGTWAEGAGTWFEGAGAWAEGAGALESGAGAGYVENAQARRPMGCFLLQGLVCVAVASVILPYFLFPAFNIAPGGKQEALGPMFQQTARYLVDHDSSEVTTDEYWAIQGVLDYNTVINSYKYNNQDDVKYSFKLDSTNEDLLDYMRAYLQMGVKDPHAYFAAIMSLAGYYVAPTDYLNIRMVTVDTKMGEDDRYMLWNPDSLDAMRTGMDEAYSAIAMIPVLNIALLMVTYVLWIPAMLLYTMLRRRLKCGVLFIPLLVLIAFCVIAPVDDARYVIPIFDTLPLFICGMAILLRKSRAEQESMMAAEYYGFSYLNPRIVYVKRARTITI